MKLLRFAFPLVTVLISLITGPAALAAEEPKLFPMRTSGITLANASAPRSLVIAYKAHPETRIAFRKYLTGEFSKKLEEWRRTKICENYQLLFQFVAGYNKYPDAILILTFPNFRATYNWNQVEEDRPGGLSPEGLKLAEPQYSMFTDRLAHRFITPADPKANVIEVGYYNVYDKELYGKFADEYIVPLWENWIGQGKGAITEYTIHRPIDAFLYGRHYTEYPEPWQAMIVLGYKDADAYSNREEMVLKSYADLQNNAAWNYWTSKPNRAKVRQQFTIAFYHQLASSWGK